MIARPASLPGLNAGTTAAARKQAKRHQFATIAIVSAAVIAFLVKLLIAYNTFGTNDVAALYMFARSLNQYGLQWTYQHGVPWMSDSTVFNHPPLTAYYLELIETLSRMQLYRDFGLTFPFLLRLPAIAADFVIVQFLLAIRKTLIPVPTWTMLLFALSPVTLMISGFHGNNDAVMVMFLLAASYMCLRDRAEFCGVFFALACQVKIVPLLFLPIFFFYWQARRQSLRFALPFAALTIILWSQPLFNFPLLFFRNVLAYGSYWGQWGITYWLELTHLPQLSGIGFSNLPPAAALIALCLKILIVISVCVLAWRRRLLGANSLVSSIAYAWIVFFVFAPGFCVYYLAWLAPFVLLLSPSFYAWLTATSTVFLFIFYNSLANGWPWFIAVSSFSNPQRLHSLMPWGLLPWAVLVCAMMFFWRKQNRATPAAA